MLCTEDITLKRLYSNMFHLTGECGVKHINIYNQTEYPYHLGKGTVISI